ncbi:PAS domain-containing sensor histidine kinase [Brevibacillus nitrificans]|uniref:PAS domain-containing sensor histidine kinase n=1 Tax=Brevibacillus nitrificans TaxID=651560 RepID=UPI00160646B7|nr:PAS domain-containing sensor histidine kinase [Brevibacillus nitrificans]
MALPGVWERYKQQFLENISDGFISFDRHWNVLHVNTKGSLLLTSERDVLLGTNVYEHWRFNEPEFFAQLRQVSESQVEAVFIEYSQRLHAWFEVKAFPSEEGIYVLFREVAAFVQNVQQEKQYFHSLFEQHPDAIYAMNLSGYYINVNPAAESLTGYSRTELVNQHFQMHIHPQDLPQTKQCFDAAAKGASQRFEARIRTKTGEMIRMKFTNMPIMVEGSIVGVYGIAQDITQQKEMENALQMSEKALAHSQRIARVGHWEMVFEKRVSYWSEETFRIFGFEPRQEPVSLDLIMAHIHPDDQKWVEQQINRARHGHPLRVEYRILRPDGEERIVLSQREVHSDRADSTKMFGIIQDITEQKRTEQLLIESQQRYQSLMTYNADGVTAIDLTGAYIEVNPVFERMTGYRKEELLQLSYSDLLGEDEAAQAGGIWDSFVKEGAPFTLSSKLVHKEGHVIEVATHHIPIIVNREVTGYFTIWRDTSGQKQTDEILRQSEKLAAVGQLAAAVAHEVRNPLTSLKGFTQLLQHQFPTADQSYFDIMKGELERIELISGELLVLAKPKPERFEQRCVNQIVNDVALLLESQANMSAVEIELTLESELPPIFCDENQLKQVFVNIMKNGIESMKDGGKMKIASQRRAQHLALSFTDEGCGIPKEELDKIGDPFYTTKEQGTGLGMMITQKIIQHHKGVMQFESEVGKGTTVTVLLPIEDM